MQCVCEERRRRSAPVHCGWDREREAAAAAAEVLRTNLIHLAALENRLEAEPCELPSDNHRSSDRRGSITRPCSPLCSGSAIETTSAQSATGKSCTLVTVDGDWLNIRHAAE
jgi:hypothetical protein